MLQYISIHNNTDFSNNIGGNKMKFRPCIDIHEGKVKQIVGSSLSDNGVKENFVSDLGTVYYADLFKKDSLIGGHIIKLCKSYESDIVARDALKAYPQGMQIGGGINDENCISYLNDGASHVIVTSYIFNNGKIDMDNLKRILSVCGKKHLVIDLSCKEVNNEYYIATDRWQKLTDTILNIDTLLYFSSFCDEFLIHAVSKEGKKSGIDKRLVEILSNSPIPVTYAGGISSLEDIAKIKISGKNKVDFTVGSSLDIFGGYLSYKDMINYK